MTVSQCIVFVKDATKLPGPVDIRVDRTRSPLYACSNSGSEGRFDMMKVRRCPTQRRPRENVQRMSLPW